MDISKKIEEIRQKPEHIRIRYVWGSVAVSMVMIVIIWIFSLEDSLKRIDSNNGQVTLPDFKKSLEELNNTNPSIQEMNNESSEAQSSEEKQPAPNQSQPEEKTGGGSTTEGVKGDSTINDLNKDTKEIINPLFPIE